MTLRPEVSKTPNNVLLMLLANYLAGGAVRIDGGQCAAGVHHIVIDCCSEAGRGAAADGNPRRIDVVTLLLQAVTDSWEVLAFSAQILTPQVPSTWLLEPWPPAAPEPRPLSERSARGNV